MMSTVPDELTSFTFVDRLPLARDALAYANELHRGQRRDSDEAPFILHPLRFELEQGCTG
jgi:(p)ppGpp synthase/HD superfamily hydrolase